MKKMTFALACASTVALFAEMAPKATFEDYTLGNGVANLAEPGLQSVYWLYNGASGSEDGSKVAGNDSAKYLELSTEGGTLWRSINAGNTSGETIDAKLGAAQAVPATGLYIDTMVQFTPTEDGGDGGDLGLGASDKLAIWLNVSTDEQGKSVTNLCARANSYDVDGGLPSATATTFTLVKAKDGTAPVIEAGTWHRLTVKAVQNLLKATSGYYLPAFQITVDGDELKAAVCPFTETMLGAMGSMADESMVTLAGTGKVLPSLQEMQGSADNVTLQAVGFKGSGALDNLQFTTEKPGVDPAGEFNVNWGSEGVQEVWGSEPPTAAELAAIQTWASANGLSADAVAGETGAAAYLLGLTKVPTTMPELKITAITQTEAGWTITIACEAQPDLSKINGSLVVKTATELGGTWTSTVVTTPAATVSVPANGAKFMKAAIGKPVPPTTE